MRMLIKDQFVLVRPHEKIYLIWLGSTLSDVDKNKGSPNYLKVLVKYWALVAKGNISIVQRCKDFWKKQSRINPCDPEHWEPISVIVWSWKPRKQSS